MGGRRLWNYRVVGESFTWGDWRAATPRYLWKCLLSDSLTIGGPANGGLMKVCHFITPRDVLFVFGFATLVLSPISFHRELKIITTH